MVIALHMYLLTYVLYFLTFYTYFYSLQYSAKTMNNYSKYLISSPLEEKWGLFVTSVGYTKIDTNQPYPPQGEHPHTHIFNWNSGRILDGYYVVVISGGSGLFESALTDTRRVKKGDCFLLFPGVWHRYKPDDVSGWEEYWVGFKGSYADHLLQKMFSPRTPFISSKLNNHLLKLFNDLIDWVQKAPSGYHQVIAGITMQIIGLAHTLTNNAENKDDNASQLVEEAKFILRETIQSTECIEQLLKKLPVSYSKIRKDFKKITGLSPNQYKLNLRLEKAKELLANTNLSISEIAYQTGFDSVFYLSKIFKIKNRRSPKAYRAQYNESSRL